MHGSGCDGSVTHGHTDLIQCIHHVASSVEVVDTGATVRVGNDAPGLVELGTQRSRQLRARVDTKAGVQHAKAMDSTTSAPEKAGSRSFPPLPIVTFRAQSISCASPNRKQAVDSSLNVCNRVRDYIAAALLQMAIHPLQQLRARDAIRKPRDIVRARDAPGAASTGVDNAHIPVEAPQVHTSDQASRSSAHHDAFENFAGSGFWAIADNQRINYRVPRWLEAPGGGGGQPTGQATIGLGHRAFNPGWLESGAVFMR